MAIIKLVEVFFDDVNWQYFILEKQYFDSLLICWYGTQVETLPLPHLSHEELLRELDYFPALLLQVLGLAIQFLPLNSPVWEFLSQSDMALCQKYSDIGAELMMHIQKENVALTTVQADFLRASWLKNIGKGVEAWRSIGNAIRLSCSQLIPLFAKTDKQQGPHKSSSFIVTRIPTNKVRVLLG